MSVNYWDNTKTLNFINMIKNSTILWNKFSKNFRNKAKRDDRWQEIAKTFKLPVFILKMKYKSLASQFLIEHKKKRENPDYKSKWRFYEAMRFLKDNSNVHTAKVVPKIGLMEESNAENPVDISKKQANVDSIDDTIEKVIERVCGEAVNSEDDDDVLISCESENIATPIIQQDVAKDVLDRNIYLSRYWNYERTLRFLELVRERSAIWDENNVNLEDVEKAWEEIHKELNVPLEMLKNRFRTLCSNYRYERRMVAENPNHIISYIFFPHLEFLPTPKINQVIMSPRITRSASNKKAINTDNGNLNSLDSLENEKDMNWENSEALHEVLICETNENDQMNDQALQQRDEYAVFGETIANEMRQMSDYKRIQMTFKNKVLKALAEIKEAAEKQRRNNS